uniref:OBG-type G domain-containing protein n=1 Tax=Biomphalaria glabrata TaxID=6526 RepID=A0A2C9KDI9_BIOGL
MSIKFKSMATFLSRKSLSYSSASSVNKIICLCQCHFYDFKSVSFPQYYSDDSKVRSSSFIDYLPLQAIGGAGGQGLPKYGGFGGDGGQVIFVANKKILTLRQVLQKFPRQFCKAGTGENSDRFHLLGERGENLTIEVPVGVIVHLPNGKKVDLDQNGDICIAAEGGSGGNDKTNFLGIRGENNSIGLELKLLADVGLVGFPNAGKSTFLKAISKAKPKIGAYPFTTLSPQLGIMEYEDGRKITVADLPGLIEGAHQNFGMGIKFLRHAERNKILLYMLDINPFQLSFKYPERSAFETLLILIQELEEYGHGMLDKPSILALNKIDTDSDFTKTKDLLNLIKNLPDSLSDVREEFHPKRLPVFDDIFTISAMKGENTLQLKESIRRVMDDYAEKKIIAEMEAKNSLLKSSDDLNPTEKIKSVLV